MSDKERHRGCGGWVYSHHQGNEWFLFCQKCGLKTNVYDTHAKARIEWDKMIEPQAERSEEKE